PILVWIVGSAYAAAHPVLVWYALGLVLAIYGYALQPAMLASGRPQLSLSVHVISTAVYLPLLVWLLQSVGVVGAAFAFLSYNAIWIIAMSRLQWPLIAGRQYR